MQGHITTTHSRRRNRAILVAIPVECVETFIRCLEVEILILVKLTFESSYLVTVNFLTYAVFAISFFFTYSEDWLISYHTGTTHQISTNSPRSLLRNRKFLLRSWWCSIVHTSLSTWCSSVEFENITFWTSYYVTQITRISLVSLTHTTRKSLNNNEHTQSRHDEPRNKIKSEDWSVATLT